MARRLVCEAPLCRRRIFAEQFEDGVVAERSRRTSRMECIVHHLGLALGGRPAAGFAKRLMMPVSNDTLLRVVRRRAKLPAGQPNVIGIDDWARRRNHRYGTIVWIASEPKLHAYPHPDHSCIMWRRCISYSALL